MDTDNLSDIPKELADSIRLVFSYMEELAQLPSDSYFQSRLMPKKGSPKKRLQIFTQRGMYLRTKSDIIPSCLDTLRKIDTSTQPNLYQYMVDLYLDVIKYNIRNAAKKTGIRRMIERHIHKLTGNYLK